MKILRLSPKGRAAPAALAALSAAAALTLAAPVAHADTTWTVRPTPFTLGTSSLLGVSAAGPDSVLIGGYQVRTSVTLWCPPTPEPCLTRTHQNPTLQRWNGSGWSWISTPGLSGKGQIKFVDATAEGTWAAGSRDLSSGTDSGTPYVARTTPQGWSELPMPSTLKLVEALDADGQDAWIAGSATTAGAPTVYRYSGGSLTPHSPGASIQSIKQRTATDVWAVGRTTEEENAYVGRYDGTTWHTMTPPQVQGERGRIVAVLPLAADDVWVTGYVYRNGSTDHASYHWDGTSWREHVLPAGARVGGGQYHESIPSRGVGWFYGDGLVEDGAGGLWAVPAPKHGSAPRILHYTDGSWRVEQAVDGVTGAIQGITRVPGSNTVWAVGFTAAGKPLVISRD